MAFLRSVPSWFILRECQANVRLAIMTRDFFPEIYIIRQFHMVARPFLRIELRTLTHSALYCRAQWSARDILSRVPYGR